MVQYPGCPYCGNSNTALSVVDVEIDGFQLKGIQCNNPECHKYLGFFKDYDKELEEIKERLNEIESRISDKEG